MDYNDYLNSISERFSNMEEIKIGESLVRVSYEEKFKIQWVATKLKIFSFIHYIEKIDLDDSEIYCFSNAEFMEDSIILNVNFERLQKHFLSKTGLSITQAQSISNLCNQHCVEIDNILQKIEYSKQNCIHICLKFFI